MQLRKVRQDCVHNLLLTFAVEIDSTNLSFQLVKADVVETLKTCSIDCAQSVVRH